MTNNLIYSGIGVIIGFILGGWLVGSVCGKEYKKKIDALQDKNERLKEENRRNNEKGFLEREEALKIARENGYSADEVDLKFDKDEPIEFDDPFADESEEDIQDEIYLIPEKNFSEDVEYRDNETLTYYQVDGILVDDHNVEVENQLKVVGKEFLDKAPDTKNDFLYVSNDIEDKMYEIIIDHNQNFYRDIMGQY